MLEQYRPEHYRAVAAFARKLENFFYVRLIIRVHARGQVPGGCFVWREDGRIVAFQAVAYLNSDDAFLWGMRVDPAHQNRGVATQMTRQMLPLIRKAGRTWVGLNTLDRRGDRPTFRVMEKLGFRPETTDATDVYWRRPEGVARPRLAPLRDVFGTGIRRGRRLLFSSRYGWLWSRLLPGRRAEVNAGGARLDGVPVHVVRRRYVEKGRRNQVVVANLFERPPDMAAFVPRLLAMVPRKRGHLVVSYPVEWAREFRRAARAAIPGLRMNHGCWPSAWRIYARKP
ncbi:GNAT family N-acetyltransferase [candidate division WOR-3 bacterium]|nr:GNAT family N-acetyltransferase [candidate division WOR-3 bacterium]